MLIIAALLIGLVAAILVFRVIAPDHNAPKKYIVVAAEDITAGTALASGQVTTIEWASDKLPKGAFENPALLINRIVRTNVYAHEPLLATHLALPASKAGMTAMISPGKRAISIGSDEVIGVAGFARPGAYVDVLVSAKDANDLPFSKVVLERIRILAVEQETEADPNKPKVVKAVTLEMTPAEAERLDLARSVGNLSLVLRNEFDAAPGQTSGARINDLFVGTAIVYAPPGPQHMVPGANGRMVPLPEQPVAVPASAGRAGTPAKAPSRARPAAFGVEEIRGTGNDGGMR